MRVLLRVLAPLFGLALAAVGVLTVVEVVVAWLQPADDTNAGNGVIVPWRAWQQVLDTQTWSTNPVRLTAVVVGVVGLLLLLVALAARRHDVPLRPPTADVTVTTSPQALARMLGRRIRASDSVTSAAVTASRRSVSVRAEGWDSADGTTGLAATVRQDVESLLDDLPLATRPRVSVAVRGQRGPR